MFAITLALILGVIAGTFTGLIPGIHINLVAAFIVAGLPLLSTYVSPFALVVFIVAMSITHTFVDFIPSMYLGAPEEDTALAVLPGHVMLKEGKGHEGILLTLIGSLGALGIIALGTPLFLAFIPALYAWSKSYVPFVLVFGILYLTLREQRPLRAFVVFFLAGILGYAALNLPVEQPLLPLLSGLFGISGLVVSLQSNPKIPKQTFCTLREALPPKKELAKAFLASTATAPLCSFLPGFGSGHAAVLASEIGAQSPKVFLILVGGINTIVMGLSFAATVAIDRARSGSAAAMQIITPDMGAYEMYLLVGVMVVTGMLATYLTIQISRLCANVIATVPYALLSKGIILFLCIVIAFLSNWLGWLVLLVSSAFGIFAILSDVRRINMMGALILPSLLYYLV